MKTVATIIGGAVAGFILLLAVVAIFAPDVETPATAIRSPAVPPPPAPVLPPPPPPQPDRLPDPDPTVPAEDTYLDSLAAECRAGEIYACDDLYWDSPVGSDYEAEALPYSTLLLAWELHDTQTQQGACSEYRRDAAAGYQFFDSVASFEEYTRFFDWACNGTGA